MYSSEAAPSSASYGTLHTVNDPQAGYIRGVGLRMIDTYFEVRSVCNDGGEDCNLQGSVLRFFHGVIRARRNMRLFSCLLTLVEQHLVSERRAAIDYK